MADYLFDGEETIATLVCGVDEAGRGPLAGPVVAAAVILNPDHPIEGLRDSKKLTAHAREVLAEQIKTHALAWAIAESSVADIDRMNILQATMAAMRKAVLQLDPKPDLVLVDGNRLPELPFRAEPIVKGDDLIPEISAASILAKTYRDALMRILGGMYPKYGFEQHAGYGTAYHLKMLEKWGPCPVHRMTFGPVALIAKKFERRADRKKRKGQ